MARVSDAGRASDKVIERLVDALDERNEHMAEIIRVTTSVEGQVRALRSDLFARPTREEVTHKRRVTVVLLLLFGYLLLGFSDFNVEQCSPGYKAGIVVDELAKGVRLTPAQFQVLINKRVSPLCDVAFPMHKHDGRDTWPTNLNTLGFVLVLCAAGAVATYARGPRGWQPRIDPVEKP